MKTHRNTRPVRHGFTLLEMMLVLVIIGLLSAVAIYAIGPAGERARIDTTKIKMRGLKQVLTNYQLDKAGYPPTLAVLTTGANPYIDSVPMDAWKHELIYAVPGSNGKPYTLYSTGKDGERGTQDDIDLWTMDQETPTN